jgi:hypothetical protein
MDSNKILDQVSLTKASHYFLTTTGVFTNTQTVTIGGVVFTFVTALSTGPAVAGEIKIGTAAANLLHLDAVIKNPYLASNANFTALSAADSAKLAALKISSVTSATVLTVFNPFFSAITMAETQTNAAWTSYSYSAPLPLSNKSNTSIQLHADSLTSGNAAMTVEVSNDGVNFVAYNRLITNVAKTNAQTDIGTNTISATASGTSYFVMIPSTDSFAYLRTKLVITTDGVYSVFVYNR